MEQAAQAAPVKDAQAPVRIFIGATPDQLDLEAEIALEFSIRSKSSLPVELHWMRLSRDPASPFFSDQDGGGYDTRSWMTPFTNFRWSIPKLCNHAGRAIYMDYDMLVLADIAELWRLPLNRSSAYMARDRSHCCVMLMNCAHPSFSRGANMQIFPPDQNWNCLDGERLPRGDPRMKIIHFTTINTQPHLTLAQGRLSREGKQHWFTGEHKRHWRPELIQLWAEAFLAGRRMGYGEPGNEFGSMKLADASHYRGMLPR